MQDFIFCDTDEMERQLQGRFCKSDDFKLNRLHGVRFDCLLLFCDGMLDLEKCWQILMRPVLRLLQNPLLSPDAFLKRLYKNRNASFDVAKQNDLEQLMHLVMGGAAAIFVAGSSYALTIGLPGYTARSISDSFTEQNVHASREGFTEPIKVNQTLIRRRLKTENLVFHNLQIGSISKTDVSVVYLRGRAQQSLVDQVVKRLEEIQLEMVLDSGSIEGFLAKPGLKLASGVGHTERPDVLCGKLREGKVGILVDGSPFAILLPYLFFENFQNMDDYAGSAYYASFMRVMRLCAFLVSAFFPGIYVAMVNYSPELIPSTLLFNIASGEFSTPLPLMLEALFVHTVYELVREAGLRLPQPVGHSVSLIGALVVGDAAINAGIVSSTMVMVIAFAAVCSYTVPKLYAQVAVFRLAFLLLGGLAGPLGICFGFLFVGMGMLGMDSYGWPYTSPAVPLSGLLFHDSLFRSPWRSFAKSHINLADYPHDGSDEGRENDANSR